MAISGLRSRRRSLHNGLRPQILRDRERLDAEVMPPGLFVASVMDLAVVLATERYGEFVTDLHTKRSWLSET